MAGEQITLDKDVVKKLVNNFYKAHQICDELNVYEHPELDDKMEEMKDWVDEQFGGKF